MRKRLINCGEYSTLSYFAYIDVQFAATSSAGLEDS